jgi:hypothetical protein
MSEKKKRLQEKKEVTQKVNNAHSEYVNSRVEQISAEAQEAINLIVNVVHAVSEKNKEKALEEIEKAIGKVEVLISKDPALTLVPVDVKEQVIDYPGTVDDVVKAKDEVVVLLAAGELQLARDIMLTLASEINIIITTLPLGGYPEVLKAIVPFIEQEKFEEATTLLYEALETLVIQKVVLPLPVLRAKQAIIVASELTKDKEDANKDTLKELLAYAKEQLVLAQALGYGKVEEDYKDIFEEIEKLEKILEGDESTKDIFEELKEKLTSFMKSFDKASAISHNKKEEENK